MNRRKWYKRKLNTETATGKIYDVSRIYGHGNVELSEAFMGHIGVPADVFPESPHYYATPHRGATPFVTTNGVRAFYTFAEAAAWLLGVSEASSSWLGYTKDHDQLRTF
jgi:hypothetical protein